MAEKPTSIPEKPKQKRGLAAKFHPYELMRPIVSVPLPACCAGRSEGRRPWSVEEDNVLREAVAAYGLRAWPSVATSLHARTGKQCRERWHNHLDSAVKKEPWQPAEERKLVELQRTFGNRWADITRYLPGRTDNAIKNHWNSVLHRGETVDHLRVADGTIPTEYPNGVPEMPAAWQTMATSAGGKGGGSQGGPMPQVERPTQQEADKINALLRIDPTSTLAIAVGFPVSASVTTHHALQGGPALMALLTIVRARNKQELYTGTVALQQAVRICTSPLVAVAAQPTASTALPWSHPTPTQLLAHELAEELELGLIEETSEDGSTSREELEDARIEHALAHARYHNKSNEGAPTDNAVIAEAVLAPFPSPRRPPSAQDAMDSHEARCRSGWDWAAAAFAATPAVPTSVSPDFWQFHQALSAE